MKNFISKFISKPFKSFPYLGRFRFWCLYWAYRITGWHIRQKEWDWILEYLPELVEFQDVSVLDVGTSRTLFCHEVEARGYDLLGIDLERYQGKYPGQFFLGDITKKIFVDMDFITCISVLEHINDREKALYNMIHSLRKGGRLLLTIPTYEYAQGHPWEGFNHTTLSKLLPVNSKILEYTERAGQICCCVIRTH